MLEFGSANSRRCRYRRSFTITAADQIMRKTHYHFATVIAPAFSSLGVDGCFNSARFSTIHSPRV
jgi:hypothetical protein